MVNAYSRWCEEIWRQQRAATRLVPGLPQLAHKERLKELDLYSLDHCWVWCDLIRIFEKTSGLSNIYVDWCVTSRLPKNWRDHSCMFFKPQTRISLRATTFAGTSVNPWNAFPMNVSCTYMLKVFKRVIDVRYSPFSPILFSARIFLGLFAIGKPFHILLWVAPCYVWNRQDSLYIFEKFCN